jgi:SAM-dependent methyltransferase
MCAMEVITPSHFDERFKKTAQYYADSRSDLLSLIPKNSKHILDVGCGSADRWAGYPADVYGVEINEEAAAKARKILKSVVTGDVEKEPLPFEDGFFDCIVFADVLEHLYDPWGMLQTFKPKLAKNGCVLISVPNIRHYRVLRALVFKGRFPYEESGILDIDHLRFFTRREVVAMLEQTGFEIADLKRKISASAKHRFLNRLCFGAFSDFLAEQFYILARRV